MAALGAELVRVKVLVACLVHDYGRPERGLSYEYYNLYLGMQEVAEEVVLFDFYRLFAQQGKEAMNRALVELVRGERPDVALFALFGDEFAPEAIEEARRQTTTVAYFFDDSWRRDYLARWAPRFDYFTTPSRERHRRYLTSGLVHAVCSPFAYNPAIYAKQEIPKRYDVSFVGGNHPWRVYAINRLRKAGFDVSVFGSFWPAGKLDQTGMVELYNASKINLNLSNSRQWDVRYLLSSWRGARNTLRRPKRGEPKDREQIKARHFEIPGCGAFQLTQYCEELERHFEIGDEVAIYLDVDDLIDKVGHYLAHDDERERIAAAGYERARREHTTTKRLRELLAEVGGGSGVALAERLRSEK